MRRAAVSDQARVRALSRWFERSARDLPWRRERTAWSALVAETMLQQTQVSRVCEYFPRFMRRFPSPADLASARVEDVMALWQGMGYYRRARHLHAAARQIVERHDGRVPGDVPTLLGLPGVGRYTAGAVASMIFGHAVPIVDGNVHRVLARWHGDDAPLSDGRGAKRAWKRSDDLLGVRGAKPAVVNEALMELGAVICTPRAPRCEECPVRRHCMAHAQGRAEEIPAPRRRAPRSSRHYHVLVCRRGERVLLEPRPEGGLFGGFWQPPTLEAEHAMTSGEVAERSGFSVTPLTTFRHETTHVSLSVHVYRGVARGKKGVNRIWQALDSIHARPLSRAHRKALEIALDAGELSGRGARRSVRSPAPS